MRRLLGAAALAWVVVLGGCQQREAAQPQGKQQGSGEAGKAGDPQTFGTPAPRTAPGNDPSNTPSDQQGGTGVSGQSQGATGGSGQQGAGEQKR